MENNELQKSERESINADKSEILPDMKEQKPKKKKLSGAYYYVETDEAELAKTAFTRTLLTVIALLLQLVVLMLPQDGLKYVTENIPSYAYVYMWAVFVMSVASIYAIVMNMTRSKIQKRVPKEHAPRRGFKHRTFICSELFIAFNALIFAIELSFVCIHFDGVGLVAMFISALATAAAVGARQIGWLALRDAELIPAPDIE